MDEIYKFIRSLSLWLMIHFRISTNFLFLPYLLLKLKQRLFNDKYLFNTQWTMDHNGSKSYCKSLTHKCTQVYLSLKLNLLCSRGQEVFTVHGLI